MPTEVFMGLPDVPDHRSDQDGKKLFPGTFSPHLDQLLGSFYHTAV